MGVILGLSWAFLSYLQLSWHIFCPSWAKSGPRVSISKPSCPSSLLLAAVMYDKNGTPSRRDADFRKMLFVLSLAAARAPGMPKTGSKKAKMAPRWPQDGPKMAPRWPQDGPEMAPRWSLKLQDCPRWLQEGSKKAKMAPSWPQDGPKMAPRWPNDGPTMAPRWPKSALDGFKKVPRKLSWPQVHPARELKPDMANHRPQQYEVTTGSLKDPGDAPRRFQVLSNHFRGSAAVA